MFIVEVLLPGLVARVEVAGLLLGAHRVLLDGHGEGGHGEDGEGEGGDEAFHVLFLCGEWIGRGSGRSSRTVSRWAPSYARWSRRRRARRGRRGRGRR